uniref:Uncharacterized protein n=1 Tax=Tanacetum cinerariifolium TaxID=118510 RepID=A0A6L2MW85_TANCI|nr:hypothetical protein [Tanacetum cinerariifolium]
MSLLIVDLDDYNPTLDYQGETKKVLEIICPWPRKSLKKICEGIIQNTKFYILRTVIKGCGLPLPCTPKNMLAVTLPNWATAEYDVPKVLLHRSIAQDVRITSKRVV